jgi:hypothetical protein
MLKAVGCSERNSMTSFISFARRRNHDSSIDSICTRCYQTVASGDTERELETVEESHLCDPNGEFSREHVDSQRGTF